MDIGRKIFFLDIRSGGLITQGQIGNNRKRSSVFAKNLLN